MTRDQSCRHCADMATSVSRAAGHTTGKARLAHILFICLKADVLNDDSDIARERYVV